MESKKKFSYYKKTFLFIILNILEVLGTSIQNNSIQSQLNNAINKPVPLNIFSKKFKTNSRMFYHNPRFMMNLKNFLKENISLKNLEKFKEKLNNQKNITILIDNSIYMESEIINPKNNYLIKYGLVGKDLIKKQDEVIFTILGIIHILSLINNCGYNLNVDIHLLNDEYINKELLKSIFKDQNQLDLSIKTLIVLQGTCRPTVSVLSQIFEKCNTRTHIIFITGGKPESEIKKELETTENLIELIKNKNNGNIKMNIINFSDDNEYIKYLNDLDKELENIKVINNLKLEETIPLDLDQKEDIIKTIEGYYLQLI